MFFEETYREETHNSDLLDKENYTELILGIKNIRGGKLSLVSNNQEYSTVTLDDRMANFPELCRMTSSVFGGIAARNFGYAKLEIKQRIGLTVINI